MVSSNLLISSFILQLYIYLMVILLVCIFILPPFIMVAVGFPLISFCYVTESLPEMITSCNWLIYIVFHPTREIYIIYIFISFNSKHIYVSVQSVQSPSNSHHHWSRAPLWRSIRLGDIYGNFLLSWPDLSYII